MDISMTTSGIICLQSQLVASPYPTPFTAGWWPVRIERWALTPLPSAPTAQLATSFESEEERVGLIYAALADEDAKLAEAGIKEYADLLDHDLLTCP